MSKHLFAKFIICIVAAVYLLSIGYGYWISSFVIISIGITSFILCLVSFLLLCRIEEIKEEIVLFIEGLDSGEKYNILNKQLQSNKE